MSVEPNQDPKIDALRRKGALNRGADRVTAPQFHDSQFFDPKDLTQVKYEMLRLATVEGKTVTDAAASFGMSRFTFYKTREAFERDGLPGLLRDKPGPRGGHKMTQEVLAYLEQELASDASLDTDQLLRLVKERFDVEVHRRTLERAVKRVKKNARQASRQTG